VGTKWVTETIFTGSREFIVLMDSGEIISQSPEPKVSRHSKSQENSQAGPNTITKLWEQPRCPTTDGRINKMWYLYAMEFYSATKKNEILSLAGKWMELENIILSEVSQAQRPNIACSPSYSDYRPKTM
jgi:hypothetical protein